MLLWTPDFDQRSHIVPHSSMMNRILFGAALLSVLLAPAAVGAAPARQAKLLGKWQAVALEKDGKHFPVDRKMKIVFEFKTAGKIVVAMTFGGRTRTSVGTWSAAAKKLTISVKNQTEVMPYQVTAKTLRMTKIRNGVKEIMLMRRVP